MVNSKEVKMSIMWLAVLVYFLLIVLTLVHGYRSERLVRWDFFLAIEILGTSPESLSDMLMHIWLHSMAGLALVAGLVAGCQIYVGLNREFGVQETQTLLGCLVVMVFGLLPTLTWRYGLYLTKSALWNYPGEWAVQGDRLRIT